MSGDFKVHAELDAFSKGGEDDRMWVGGIVSTSKLDKQDEQVIQSGLDFSEFLADGWFNDNHGQRSVDVLGYPTEARYVQKGEKLPSGRPARSAGWYTEGYLLNTEEGRKVWNLARSLERAPRKLGFSIEGKVLKRDQRNPKVIAKAKVRNVAITHCPVNTDTELVTLSKALMAGSAIANPGASPGEGFALRGESLEGGKPGVPQPVPDAIVPKDGNGDDPSEIATEDEEKGCGCDDDVKKATEADFDVEPMSEVELAHEWADSIAKFVSQPTPRLSKAQAEQFIAASRPDLSAEAVRKIVEGTLR